MKDRLIYLLRKNFNIKIFYIHNKRVWFRWKIGSITVIRTGVSIGKTPVFGNVTGYNFEIRYKGHLKLKWKNGYSLEDE